MRLLDLSIQNIGPFDEAYLEFLSAPDDPVPVAIITGENGTGKTILLDAIRGLFGEPYGRLERAIWRNGTPFQMKANLVIDGRQETLLSNRKHHTEGVIRFSPRERDALPSSHRGWKGQIVPQLGGRFLAFRAARRRLHDQPAHPSRAEGFPA